MDASRLLTDEFLRSVLLALATTIIPFAITFFSEHFGWRTSLRKDAELYRYLAEVAGNDASDEEVAVMKVVRKNVFDRARAHTILHSKGLEVAWRVFKISMYSVAFLSIPAIVAEMSGHAAFASFLMKCAFFAEIAMLASIAIFTPWSIYDYFRWAKARETLNETSGELLFTNDSNCTALSSLLEAIRRYMSPSVMKVAICSRPRLSMMG